MTLKRDNLNLTMLCDFYELTMGNGYFKYGLFNRHCAAGGQSKPGGSGGYGPRVIHGRAAVGGFAH